MNVNIIIFGWVLFCLPLCAMEQEFFNKEIVIEGKQAEAIWILHFLPAELQDNIASYLTVSRYEADDDFQKIIEGKLTNGLNIKIANRQVDVSFKKEEHQNIWSETCHRGALAPKLYFTENDEKESVVFKKIDGKLQKVIIENDHPYSSLPPYERLCWGVGGKGKIIYGFINYIFHCDSGERKVILLDKLLLAEREGIHIMLTYEGLALNRQETVLGIKYTKEYADICSIQPIRYLRLQKEKSRKMSDFLREKGVCHDWDAQSKFAKENENKFRMSSVTSENLC